jgi:hypothetical protein
VIETVLLFAAPSTAIPNCCAIVVQSSGYRIFKFLFPSLKLNPLEPPVPTEPIEPPLHPKPFFPQQREEQRHLLQRLATVSAEQWGRGNRRDPPNRGKGIVGGAVVPDQKLEVGVSLGKDAVEAGGREGGAVVDGGDEGNGRRSLGA